METDYDEEFDTSTIPEESPMYISILSFILISSHSKVKQKVQQPQISARKSTSYSPMRKSHIQSSKRDDYCNS